VIAIRIILVSYGQGIPYQKHKLKYINKKYIFQVLKATNLFIVGVFIKPPLPQAAMNPDDAAKNGYLSCCYMNTLLFGEPYWH
jgi:hypothetical protein